MGALYEATIPAFILGLGNLRSWLGKAEQHAAGGSVAVSDLLEARLAPDMFNLIQQVGYAYFTALEAAEHLSGREPPEMGYDETSMDELRASIDRVTEYLRSIGPDDVAPRESTEVETFLLPGSRLPIAGPTQITSSRYGTVCSATPVSRTSSGVYSSSAPQTAPTAGTRSMAPRTDRSRRTSVSPARRVARVEACFGPGTASRCSGNRVAVTAVSQMAQKSTRPIWIPENRSLASVDRARGIGPGVPDPVTPSR